MYSNDEVYAYDSLDAQMGRDGNMDIDDADGGMSAFANTEFDHRGMIVSAGVKSAGSAARPLQSRPKSVNWPDDPSNISLDGERILVINDEWGEWGSSTPGDHMGGGSGGAVGGALRNKGNNAAAQVIAAAAAAAAGPTGPNAQRHAGNTPGPGAVSHHISANAIGGGGGGGGGIAARGGGAGAGARDFGISVARQKTPLQTFQIGSENANDIAMRQKTIALNANNAAAAAPSRSILSRAVSRAVGNTVQNRRDHVVQTGGKVAFGRDGFADDGVVPFGDMDVNASEALSDQKFNNKYLEYRAQQVNRARATGAGAGAGAGAAVGAKQSNMARTHTIISPVEVVPPVLSSKLVSQGIVKYEVVNKGVNLDTAVQRDERRVAQEQFKHALDMDKVNTISQTRRPAPRLDPAEETTGFWIGAQRNVAEPPKKRDVQAEWVAQLEADASKHGVDAPASVAARKEFVRKPFTPLAHSQRGGGGGDGDISSGSGSGSGSGSMSSFQLAASTNSQRLEAFKRGEQKRQELHRHREDLLQKISASSYSLAEVRKAKSFVGGKASYAENKYVYDDSGSLTQRPPSRYDGFIIGNQ